MRIKRSVTARNKHKKILKLAKGMQHARRRSFRLAKQGVIRALQYAYRDRRNKKRDLRGTWITRINAAARENGTTYAKLINDMNKAGIELDRKVLAELAANEPKAFAAVVKAANKYLSKLFPSKNHLSLRWFLVSDCL
jgi:large subunit ribosomal protein L20